MADLANSINLEKIGLTLKIKVNRLGQLTELRFSVIRDIENVRIDTEIETINSMHTAGDKQGHRTNVYDLEFQDQSFEIRKLFQHF